MLFLALANKLCVTILMGLGGDEFFFLKPRSIKTADPQDHN